MELEKIVLENEIRNLVKSDNGCETKFTYEIVGTVELPLIMVKAITFNPIKNVSFLLFKAIEDDENKALVIILEYVKHHRRTYYSHSVVWMKKTENITKKSYFFVPDAISALEKFFDDKQREDYLILEVKLHPLA